MRIHPNDSNKLTRAIEVSLLARKPMSEQFAAGRDPLTGYRVLKIGLAPQRALLNQRLDERLARMFESGLIGEVRNILALGYPPSAKPFESLGYKEGLAVVEGRMTLEEALAAAQLATRQYAKRQMTWFRREKEVTWFEGFGEDSSVKAKTLDLIKSSLTHSTT